MQEIKKRRIVIASVLKPVDDTRMFEKIGRSLASSAEVQVIGFEGQTSGNVGNPRQISIGRFARLSFRRLIAPWRILRHIFRLQPDLLIVTTHELLLPALVAKIFLGCRIWYDVQENYARNIRYTTAFPPLLRDVIAFWVRVKERVAFGWIDRYLLAERNYTTEMPYLASKSVVIENKFLPPPDQVWNRKDHPGARRKLLFSGTLSESTGVFIAVDLATALFREDETIVLTIIGHCPKSKDYAKLVSLQAERPFMRIIGGPALVPYASIREEIDAADFGIIAYPPNPSTSQSVPTKLYEYLANRLPILLIRNPGWEALVNVYEAAVTFEPESISGAAILKEMRSKEYYPTDPQDVYWKSEERKLLDSADAHFRKH